jgi:hypothetical protein
LWLLAYVMLFFSLYDQIVGHGNPPPYADAVLERVE